MLYSSYLLKKISSMCVSLVGLQLPRWQSVAPPLCGPLHFLVLATAVTSSARIGTWLGSGVVSGGRCRASGGPGLFDQLL